MRYPHVLSVTDKNKLPSVVHSHVSTMLFKRTLIVILILVFVTFILCLLLITGVRMPHYRKDFQMNNTRSRYIKVFPEQKWQSDKSSKTILVWTGYFSDAEWDELTNFPIRKCQNPCLYKRDRSLLKEADAVVFHLNDLKQSSMPLYRHPSQVWVLFNFEPLTKASSVRGLNDVFNWTLWYRRDATVFAPYGKTERINREIKQEENIKNHAEGKNRMASATISNCYEDAKRHRIIDKLKKYIEVDIYGRCSKNDSCPKHSSECKQLLSQYKFHLAFENSVCRDYITEKFWNTLDDEHIPVVNWGYMNKDLVPPNSFINIFDFPDIKSLAAYLDKVSKNESLYNSYFEWRKDFEIKCDISSVCYPCALCDALHNSRQPAQVYTDLEGWIEDDICQKYTILKDIGWKIDRTLFDIGL